MNVLFKAEDGKLDRIDTYIGVEGNEFVCVGCAKGLSAPGVIFSYGEYVRFQRANKATYLEFFGFIEKLVVFYLENSGHKITLYTKRWFALANHFFLCYNIFRYFSIFGGFLLTLNQYLL